MEFLKTLAYRIFIVYPAIFDQFFKVAYWGFGIIGWYYIIKVCRQTLGDH